MYKYMINETIRSERVALERPITELNKNMGTGAILGSLAVSLYATYRGHPEALLFPGTVATIQARNVARSISLHNNFSSRRAKHTNNISPTTSNVQSPET